MTVETEDRVGAQFLGINGGHFAYLPFFLCGYVNKAEDGGFAVTHRTFVIRHHELAPRLDAGVAAGLDFLAEHLEIRAVGFALAETGNSKPIKSVSGNFMVFL